MVDIAMTATLRPEIVKQTLDSLQKNLIYDGGFRLVVNIDPIGKGNSKEMVDLVHSYFPGTVVQIPTKPNHSEAQRWVWDQATSEYVLQWQDDWELLKSVRLGDLLDLMRDAPSVGQIYFDRSGKSVLDYPGYRDCFVKLPNGLWNRIKGKSLGGPPAILRLRYIHEVLPLINGDLDTLSQTDLVVRQVVDKWAVWVFTGENGNLVRDLGRGWSEKNGISSVKLPSGLVWRKIGTSKSYK